MIDEEQLQQVSAIFSALGSPTRLKIIELVSETQRPLHIKAVAQVSKKRLRGSLSTTLEC